MRKNEREWVGHEGDGAVLEVKEGSLHVHKNLQVEQVEEEKPADSTEGSIAVARLCKLWIFFRSQLI